MFTIWSRISRSTGESRIGGGGMNFLRVSKLETINWREINLQVGCGRKC